ncbi:hypothetical protein SAY86_022724 [Trapa natans]|uniref:Uncharacterized protein n=1 Tax=Trapa natans TaxID=22666 RepID=A0AAN7R4Q5_TRANT|nr:hypothetical protein SAY86_022724 [Trapa natans]
MILKEAKAFSDTDACYRERERSIGKWKERTEEKASSVLITEISDKLGTETESSLPVSSQISYVIIRKLIWAIPLLRYLGDEGRREAGQWREEKEKDKEDSIS